MPGLGASFGRGAATTYQQDLANSDCILFMGSNMAEAHPVGFRWPMKAKERGATLIHVDPRFTRTSALCDVYVGIRAGSDVAFLGGLVNFVLSHDRWLRSMLGRTRTRRQSLGMGSRTPRTWRACSAVMKATAKTAGTTARTAIGVTAGTPADPDAATSASCVFQILKRHFARYTPDVVSQVCGCSPEQFNRVAELLRAIPVGSEPAPSSTLLVGRSTRLGCR